MKSHRAPAFWSCQCCKQIGTELVVIRAKASDKTEKTHTWKPAVSILKCPTSIASASQSS